MVATNKNYVKNNPLIESNMAIIVTSHSGHNVFLKYALSRYRETKNYVILSYDRHGESIPVDILDIPHSVVFKHKTYGAEKRLGWLFDIIYAAGTILLYNNFEYVITTNSDCIWDKPNNIDKLVDLLGNNDIMSASSEPNLIHTCCVLWKRECFLHFVNHIINKLSINKPEGYSPEVLLRDFIYSRKYKVKHVTKQPLYPKNHFYEGKIDHYSSYFQDSTFKDIVGYRNLGGEHKVSCQEHLEPVPREYFDARNEGEFLNSHEKQTLYMYYMTNDRRWLYKYWAEGESSDFNRRYYSIEYYGDKYLYDDSKRKEFGPPSERLGHFNRFKCDSYILKDEKYYNGLKEEIEKRGYGDGS